MVWLGRHAGARHYRCTACGLIHGFCPGCGDRVENPDDLRCIHCGFRLEALPLDEEPGCDGSLNR